MGEQEGFPKASPQGALPHRWEQLWGEPSPFLASQLSELREHFAALAVDIPLYDHRAELGDLVGPFDNYLAPVHRWYPYKESFSYELPGYFVDQLEIEPAGTAIDVFAGVATTALGLRDRGFERVLGLEYSPFSRFVGEVKVSSPTLDLARIEGAINDLLCYRTVKGRKAPALSSFSNNKIFSPNVLDSLLSARNRIHKLDWIDAPERNFLLLALAAIVEEVSGAMKDGRALRIIGDRKRASRMLVARENLDRSGDPVRDSLTMQLAGMREDLEDLAELDEGTETTLRHLAGDARNLAEVKGGDRVAVFKADSASFSVFSPPYLNCIDYSEIYKLELWLLELIENPEQFRNLRLGTLRSHPSVDFPDRGYLEGVDKPFATLVDKLSTFVERNHAQAAIGRNYFDDMYRVFAQQAWALAPGAWMVCIVGNSTFSRRIFEGEERKELWRIPVLTDVILASMAEALGLEDVQIWNARDLRARNVTSGSARESAIVARKPES
jgi:hypothetical protein